MWNKIQNKTKYLTAINIMLIICFCFLPTMKLSTTVVGVNGGFSASALRIMFLIPRFVVTLGEYSGLSMEWLKIGYGYAIIPILAFVSVSFLLCKRASHDYYYQSCKITYIITILMTFTLIIIKLISFGIYNLNSYPDILTVSFRSGIYANVVLAVVGLKMASMSPKDEHGFIQR